MVVLAILKAESINITDRKLQWEQWWEPSSAFYHHKNLIFIRSYFSFEILFIIHWFPIKSFFNAIADLISDFIIFLNDI